MALARSLSVTIPGFVRAAGVPLCLAMLSFSRPPIGASEGHRLRRSLAASPSLRSSRRPLLTSSHGSAADAFHVSLVVDINKTILFEDPAGGKGMEHLLNEIISEVAWGRVDLEGKWAPVHGLPLSVERPPGGGEGLLTYSDHVFSLNPDRPGIDLQAVKRTRDSLRGSFTETGRPGHCFAGELEEISRRLMLPPNLCPDLVQEAGLQGRTRVAVLPAFLHLLRKLEERRWSYSVQLRTFGSDTLRVIREFNAFVEGKHPLFPGQGLGLWAARGEEAKGGRDHRLDLSEPGSHGSFYRDEDGAVLVLGVTKQPSSRAEVARLEREGYRVLNTPQAICDYMTVRHLSAQPTLALRDYWPHWRKCLEASHAGKMVIIHPSARDSKPEDWGRRRGEEGAGGTRRRVYTVVLDDNIEADDAHIIDLRAYDGSSVPFDEAWGRWLIRVEPFLAINEPETYFVRAVDKALARQLELHGARGG